MVDDVQCLFFLFIRVQTDIRSLNRVHLNHRIDQTAEREGKLRLHGIVGT